MLLIINKNLVVSLAGAGRVTEDREGGAPQAGTADTALAETEEITEIGVKGKFSNFSEDADTPVIATLHRTPLTLI